MTHRIKLMLCVLAVTASLGAMSLLWPGRNTAGEVTKPVSSNPVTTSTAAPDTATTVRLQLDEDTPEGCVAAVEELRGIMGQSSGQLGSEGNTQLGEALSRLDGLCSSTLARQFRERELNAWAGAT
jgi:hypothetical protein